MNKSEWMPPNKYNNEYWLKEHHEIYNSDGYMGECYSYQKQFDAWEAGAIAGAKAFAKWADELCTEHFIIDPNEHGPNGITTDMAWRCPGYHKDCPLCWKQMLKEIGEME